ncbi:hypothetical protein GQX74_014715, partial [Glossina fuscipes]
IISSYTRLKALTQLKTQLVSVVELVEALLLESSNKETTSRHLLLPLYCAGVALIVATVVVTSCVNGNGKRTKQQWMQSSKVEKARYVKDRITTDKLTPALRKTDIDIPMPEVEFNIRIKQFDVLRNNSSATKTFNL